MILSPSLRLCFVKTRKTGGTSVEVALRRIVGLDAIVTPLLPAPANLDQPRGRNWYGVFNPVPDVWYQWRHTGGGFPGRNRGLYKPIHELLRRRKFYEHMSLSEISHRWSGDLSRMFTFAFERNPWDKAISWWMYWNRGRLERVNQQDFDEWLLSPATRGFYSEWWMYSRNGQVAVDFLGRYERLDQDLAEALRRAGYTGVIDPLTQEKKQPRPLSIRYNARTTARIRELFAREIELLGYDIPEHLAY